jgi:HK97 family phage prohead protease
MDQKIVKYNTTKAVEVDGDRVLRFIGSDSNMDRDGDVIDINAWNLKQYKNNPVVLLGHKYSDLPVAKTKKVWIDKDKGQLVFDIEFPDASVSAIGDTLYKLYKNGFMTATSVGFIPDYKTIEYPKNVKGPSRIIRNADLLEISLVSVPANPRALLTSKSIDEAKRLDIVDELELKQLEGVLDVDTIVPDVKDDINKKVDEVLEQINVLRSELDILKSKVNIKVLYESDESDINTYYSNLIDELKQ